MKAYIGNRILCLAQPEEKEGVEGCVVIYPDGSETFLAKEIFDFEFRALEDEEIDLMIDSVNMEYTTDDIKALMSMTEEDWEETLDLVEEDVEPNGYVVDETQKVE